MARRSTSARICAALFVFVLLAAPGSAWAIEAFSAAGPLRAKSLPAERLVLDSGTGAAHIDLGEIDPREIEAVREANAARLDKRLQIGIGRPVAGEPAATSAALRWLPVAGGHAAHWRIFSRGAHALRVALDIARLPDSAELRFAGDADPATVYGPITLPDTLRDAEGLYWSPVLEGDGATLEVFVPYAHAPAEAVLDVAWVSHLFASPREGNLESLAKAFGDAGTCERDLICLSASDNALANTGKAVARMVFPTAGGGQASCTGTLLTTTAGPGAPYFYSANHCISTQASANNLTTHWFYDRVACNTGPEPIATQLIHGATLLYNDSTSDVVFLRLNDPPPPGAWYAGWSANALTNGTALTAVHHPEGDVKKVSLGSMGGFSAYGGGTGSDHIIAVWNSVATGVTEPGSSGSGIFTAVGSPPTDYQLRGGLHGGPSSCLATGINLRDYYSRFDLAYPNFSQYLNPSTPPPCAYTISSVGASVGSAGGSGSFAIATSAGCAWSAVSNAAWITTSSRGSGAGTIFYVVAPNTGAARSGTITVAGTTFTISQSAGASSSSSLLSNPGFESGNASWFETATGGLPIITNDATLAHAGSYYAWLGGYVSGTDTLYQDLIVPADADSARLQFWYRISTQETTGSVYDTLTVTVNGVSTGATLATLVTLTNRDATSGWVQSLPYDLRAFRGQAVRIKFTATNDFSNVTSFRIDDVALVAATGTAVPRLANISTRMQVLTGDNVMIAGFIVGGTTMKTVVVNVAGPSLASAGIANPLANPTLTLVRSSDGAILATNDNWQSAPNAAQILASGFAPNNPFEPAILATLPPGAYTAIVQGAGGGTGVGLIGVFEVDQPAVPLINISTRGQVLTGNDVMIAGFIVYGATPQTVVVNVAGPSLASAGIANPLADPTITLVRSADGAVLATNDDWQGSTAAAQILASGFAPHHALEPAILVTLQPGAYTAIVSGAGGATGVGLVGVFTVP